MLAKPNRRGIVIGEVWECRTGTRDLNIKQETEDPDDPGANIIRRFRVEQKVTGKLVWDGKDWQPESTWQASAKRNMTSKPKTILRKG